jgi:hypothetical protein
MNLIESNSISAWQRAELARISNAKGKVALRMWTCGPEPVAMNRSFNLYICLILHLLVGHVLSTFPKMIHGLSFLNANSIIGFRKLDFCHSPVKCCYGSPCQRYRSAVLVQEKGGSAGESPPLPEDSEEMQSNPGVSSPSPWLASLLPLITIRNKLSISPEVINFLSYLCSTCLYYDHDNEASKCVCSILSKPFERRTVY